MELEASLKHFSPSGNADQRRREGNFSDRLTGTDVMAAIGTTSSRARFGLAAFFGKAGISKTDEQLAVQALAQVAIKTLLKCPQSRWRQARSMHVDAGAVCLC